MQQIAFATDPDFTRRLTMPAPPSMPVPIEPSPAMLQAGADQLASGTAGDIVRAIYVAMLAASK